MLARVQSHWRLCLIALGLSLALLVFHGLSGTPEGESYKFNMPWFDAFRTSFWAGDLYPRFLPGLWYGMGGLDFFFYAPLPFWLSATLGEATCPGCETGTVLSLGGAWMIILSGITFFLFARRFFAAAWAGFGAIVYAVLPYHYLIDWYDRQAIGELAAMIFLPLIALGTIKLIEDGKGGKLFALSTAGLALSHLPSTLIVGHLIAALLAWGLVQQDSWDARLALIRRFALWGALGIGLSAFYWLPAISLLNTVSPDMLATDYYKSTAWLFLDGRPEIAPDRAGIMKSALVLVVMVAAAAILILRRSQASPQLKLWILGPSLFAGFLMTIFSFPIWEYWILNRVQFPWRTLLVADLALALGAVVIAKHLIESDSAADKMRARLLAAASGLALIAAVLALIPKLTDATKRGWARDGQFAAVGTAEYVPPNFLQPALADFRATVTETDIGEARYDLFFAAMARHVDVAKAGLQAAAPGAEFERLPGDRAVLRVALDTETTLQLPLLAWPYWRATGADGQAIPLSSAPDRGLVSLTLPAGQSEIHFKLAESSPQRRGSLISLLTLLILAGFILGDRIKGNFRPDKPLATSAQ